MSTIIEKTYVPNTSAVTSPVYSTSDYAVEKIKSILYGILSIIEVIIIARILFVFLGANNVGFAKFVYDISSPLVSPFFGVFNTTKFLEVTGVRLEWESIIAAICYALIFMVISAILNMFKRDNVV